MTTPITGAISLADVRTELGLSGAISFGTTLVRQLSNQLSGAVALGSARAAKYLNSTVTNQNVFSNFFGSPATATSYKVLIGTSGVIGATSGNNALVIGQFPTGSTITINNYGQIAGFGGAGGSTGVGSSGGDAIYASYANQTVTINNQTGAFIRAGGGGGGRGGTGGTGGTGGQGYYVAYNYYFYAGTYWNATLNHGYYNCNYVVNPPYVAGAYVYTDSCGYAIHQIGVPYNVITSGGAGGGGGAGGAGGRGQGYDGANAGGSTGAGGSAGAFGGTNAGRGGTGGAGGTGGTGGGYGTAGNTGGTGNTGATGASGNYSGGAGGAVGAGGSAGGAAGRYLVKGANSVTLNNSGTLAGGLA